MFGTAAVDELLGHVEALAANTVETPVGPLVHVSRPGASLPEALRAIEVTLIGGGPDEVVVAEVKHARQSPEDLGIPIDQRGRREPFPLGGQDVRQAVLIGAGRNQVSSPESRW